MHQRNLPYITKLRNRNIESLCDSDLKAIEDLFNQFVRALRRKIDGRMSPVSVAKSFSLLAPDFLPIWDSNIAFTYNCFYFSETAGKEYFDFCKKMQVVAENVKSYVPRPDDRSLLKELMSLTIQNIPCIGYKLGKKALVSFMSLEYSG